MGKSVAVLAVLLIFAGCGGSSGNGGSNNNNNNNSTPGQAQGVYSGTTSNSASFESIVLPSDQFYAIYGTASGNTLLIDGMITGQGASKSGNYTASVTDFYYTGSTFSGSIVASYVAGSSISGTLTESGNQPVTFNGTSMTSSAFNYNTAANVANVTGGWAGTLLNGSSASVTVNSDGTFTGSNSGCSFSGKMTADSSGKNFFDVTLTYGGSPCLLPNQTSSGIAVDYLLSNGVTRQLLAAVTTGTSEGTVFLANR